MLIYNDEQISNNIFLREFSPEVEESQLVWHRDKKDRKVTILSGENWKIQFDNELPKELTIGEDIFIPNNIFHRILIGRDILRLRIEES